MLSRSLCDTAAFELHCSGTILHVCLRFHGDTESCKWCSNDAFFTFTYINIVEIKLGNLRVSFPGETSSNKKVLRGASGLRTPSFTILSYR